MVVDTPVIIDTNIWIDVLGGVPDAKHLLDNHIDIAPSPISFAEVASGCEPDELAMFEAFLDVGRFAPYQGQWLEKESEDGLKAKHWVSTLLLK